MRTLHITCATLTAVALLCASAFAQTATTPPPQHIPLLKTIGQGAPKLVPSLLVMNARGATLQGGKLTLTGVTPNSIMFADRPVRAAGHALTTTLMEQWSPTNTNPDSFAKDPPNATVSVFSKEGSAIRDAVVVLKTAKLEGDKLTFDVDVLEGDIAGADGPASLFIDRFGGGFGGFHAGGFHAGGMGGFHAGGVTAFHAGGVGGYAGHVGYVGVHPAYRGAWYGAGLGAAAIGGAAIGATAAAAAAAPYYGAYGAPVCGVYPYPPCY
jgi:GNAT superfamily N-acetyltransferase